MQLDQLSREDTQILTLESSRIAGHTCKVLVVDGGGEGPITLDDLQRRIEERLPLVPRLQQRVREVPYRLGNPIWEDDPSFDVANHLNDHRAGSALTDGSFRRSVAGVMATKLSHDRPLWAIDLAGPLEDGSTTLLLRVHHCMADGLTALSICKKMLWDGTDGPSASLQKMPPLSDSALVRAAIGERARRLANGSIAVARSTLSSGSWKSFANEAFRLPGAVARELKPHATLSPLAGTVGTRREVGFLNAPLEQLKLIEHAFGERITVNDVLLAVVASGIKGWLEASGRHGREDLTVKIPVSLHHRADDGEANRDSFIIVDLHIEDTDPVQRLLDINRETTARKQRHDARELDHLFNALYKASRVTGSIPRRMESSARLFSLNLSNVPGPRGPVSIFNHLVKELYSLAEVGEHHALRISAISLAGTMFIGLCADPDVVGSLDVLASKMEGSIEEIYSRAKK